MLKDTFSRVHDYLRISLTDACNLRCFYCIPDEDHAFTAPSKLMQRDEIATLAGIFVGLGIDKIRLTGGEPLIRKDADGILRDLAKLPASLTLTSNATQIHRFIDTFGECGIRSLNVSLDSLKRERFAAITKRDRFDLVWSNIERLIDEGFGLKLNVVVTKGVNDDELLDFVALTRERGIEVRFIEFMPFKGNKWQGDTVVTLADMLLRISEAHAVTPLPASPHDTAKRFRADGHIGSFAVISTMSAPFCAGCNRLRLTADGKLKNCLFSTGEVDLLAALRTGNDVEALIREGVRRKAKALGGQLPADFLNLDGSMLDNRSMVAIGG